MPSKSPIPRRTTRLNSNNSGRGSLPPESSDSRYLDKILNQMMNDANIHIQNGENKQNSDPEAALINFMIAANNLYTIQKNLPEDYKFDEVMFTISGINYDINNEQQFTNLIKELFANISNLQDRVKSLMSSSGKNNNDDKDDKDESLEMCEKKVKQENEKTKANFCKPDCSGYDKVIGLFKEKEQILESFAYPLIYSNLYPKLSKGLLFWGPPGVGKTYIMSTTITEIQRIDDDLAVLFYAPTGASLKDKYVGGTEKNISAYFDCASENARACEKISLKKGNTKKFISIIFIDEVEAVAGKRSNDPSGMMTNSVNTLLQKMDGVGSYDNVAIVAATNYPWNLDTAVLRRLPKRIYLPLPNESEREQLVHLEIDKFTAFRMKSYDKELKMNDKKKKICFGKEESTPDRKTKLSKEDQKKDKKCPEVLCPTKKPTSSRAKRKALWSIDKRMSSFISNSIDGTTTEEIVDAALITTSGKDSDGNIRSAGYSHSDISKFCESAFTFAATRARNYNRYFITRIKDEILYLSNYSAHLNEEKGSIVDIVYKNPSFELKYPESLKLSGGNLSEHPNNNEIVYFEKLLRSRLKKELPIIYTNKRCNNNLELDNNGSYGHKLIDAINVVNFDSSLETQYSEVEQLLSSETITEAKCAELVVNVVNKLNDKFNDKKIYLAAPIPQSIEIKDLNVRCQTIENGPKNTYNIEFTLAGSADLTKENIPQIEAKIRENLEGVADIERLKIDQDFKVELTIKTSLSEDQLNTLQNLDQSLNNLNAVQSRITESEKENDDLNFVRELEYFKDKTFPEYLVDQYKGCKQTYSDDEGNQDIMLDTNNIFSSNYAFNVAILLDLKGTDIYNLFKSKILSNIKSSNIFSFIHPKLENKLAAAKQLVHLGKDKDKQLFLAKTLLLNTEEDPKLAEALNDDDKLFELIMLQICEKFNSLSKRNIFINQECDNFIYEIHTKVTNNNNDEMKQLNKKLYGIISMDNILGTIFKTTYVGDSYTRNIIDNISAGAGGLLSSTVGNSMSWIKRKFYDPYFYKPIQDQEYYDEAKSVDSRIFAFYPNRIINDKDSYYNLDNIVLVKVKESFLQDKVCFCLIDEFNLPNTNVNCYYDIFKKTINRKNIKIASLDDINNAYENDSLIMGRKIYTNLPHSINRHRITLINNIYGSLSKEDKINYDITLDNIDVDDIDSIESKLKNENITSFEKIKYKYNKIFRLYELLIKVLLDIIVNPESKNYLIYELNKEITLLNICIKKKKNIFINEEERDNNIKLLNDISDDLANLRFEDIAKKAKEFVQIKINESDKQAKNAFQQVNLILKKLFINTSSYENLNFDKMQGNANGINLVNIEKVLQKYIIIDYKQNKISLAPSILVDVDSVSKIYNGNKEDYGDNIYEIIKKLNLERSEGYIELLNNAQRQNSKNEIIKFDDTDPRKVCPKAGLSISVPNQFSDVLYSFTQHGLSEETPSKNPEYLINLERMYKNDYAMFYKLILLFRKKIKEEKSTVPVASATPEQSNISKIIADMDVKTIRFWPNNIKELYATAGVSKEEVYGNSDKFYNENNHINNRFTHHFFKKSLGYNNSLIELEAKPEDGIKRGGAINKNILALYNPKRKETTIYEKIDHVVSSTSWLASVIGILAIFNPALAPYTFLSNIASPLSAFMSWYNYSGITIAAVNIVGGIIINTCDSRYKSLWSSVYTLGAKAYDVEELIKPLNFKQVDQNFRNIVRNREIAVSLSGGILPFIDEQSNAAEAAAEAAAEVAAEALTPYGDKYNEAIIEHLKTNFINKIGGEELTDIEIERHIDHIDSYLRSFLMTQGGDNLSPQDKSIISDMLKTLLVKSDGAPLGAATAAVRSNVEPTQMALEALKRIKDASVHKLSFDQSKSLLRKAISEESIDLNEKFDIIRMFEKGWGKAVEEGEKLFVGSEWSGHSLLPKVVVHAEDELIDMSVTGYVMQLDGGKGKVQLTLDEIGSMLKKIDPEITFEGSDDDKKAIISQFIGEQKSKLWNSILDENGVPEGAARELFDPNSGNFFNGLGQIGEEEIGSLSLESDNIFNGIENLKEHEIGRLAQVCKGLAITVALATGLYVLGRYVVNREQELGIIETPIRVYSVNVLQESIAKAESEKQSYEKLPWWKKLFTARPKSTLLNVLKSQWSFENIIKSVILFKIHKMIEFIKKNITLEELNSDGIRSYLDNNHRRLKMKSSYEIWLKECWKGAAENKGENVIFNQIKKIFSNMDAINNGELHTQLFELIVDCLSENKHRYFGQQIKELLYEVLDDYQNLTNDLAQDVKVMYQKYLLYNKDVRSNLNDTERFILFQNFKKVYEKLKLKHINDIDALSGEEMSKIKSSLDELTNKRFIENILYNIHYNKNLDEKILDELGNLKDLDDKKKVAYVKKLIKIPEDYKIFVDSTRKDGKDSGHYNYDRRNPDAKHELTKVIMDIYSDSVVKSDVSKNIYLGNIGRDYQTNENPNNLFNINDIYDSIETGEKSNYEVDINKLSNSLLNNEESKVNFLCNHINDVPIDYFDYEDDNESNNTIRSQIEKMYFNKQPDNFDRFQNKIKKIKRMRIFGLFLESTYELLYSKDKNIVEMGVDEKGNNYPLSLKYNVLADEKINSTFGEKNFLINKTDNYDLDTLSYLENEKIIGSNSWKVMDQDGDNMYNKPDKRLFNLVENPERPVGTADPNHEEYIYQLKSKYEHENLNIALNRPISHENLKTGIVTDSLSEETDKVEVDEMEIIDRLLKDFNEKFCTEFDCLLSNYFHKKYVSVYRKCTDKYSLGSANINLQNKMTMILEYLNPQLNLIEKADVIEFTGSDTTGSDKYWGVQSGLLTAFSGQKEYIMKIYRNIYDLTFSPDSKDDEINTYASKILEDKTNLQLKLNNESSQSGIYNMTYMRYIYELYLCDKYTNISEKNLKIPFNDENYTHFNNVVNKTGKLAYLFRKDDYTQETMKEVIISNTNIYVITKETNKGKYGFRIDDDNKEIIRVNGTKIDESKIIYIFANKQIIIDGETYDISGEVYNNFKYYNVPSRMLDTRFKTTNTNTSKTILVNLGNNDKLYDCQDLERIALNKEEKEELDSIALCRAYISKNLANTNYGSNVDSILNDIDSDFDRFITNVIVGDQTIKIGNNERKELKKIKMKLKKEKLLSDCSKDLLVKTCRYAILDNSANGRATHISTGIKSRFNQDKTEKETIDDHSFFDEGDNEFWDKVTYYSKSPWYSWESATLTSDDLDKNGCADNDFGINFGSALWQLVEENDQEIVIKNKENIYGINFEKILSDSLNKPTTLNIEQLIREIKTQVDLTKLNKIRKAIYDRYSSLPDILDDEEFRSRLNSLEQDFVKTNVNVIVARDKIVSFLKLFSGEEYGDIIDYCTNISVLEKLCAYTSTENEPVPFYNNTIASSKAKELRGCNTGTNKWLSGARSYEEKDQIPIIKSFDQYRKKYIEFIENSKTDVIIKSLDKTNIFNNKEEIMRESNDIKVKEFLRQFTEVQSSRTKESVSLTEEESNIFRPGSKLYKKMFRTFNFNVEDFKSASEIVTSSIDPMEIIKFDFYKETGREPGLKDDKQWETFMNEKKKEMNYDNMGKTKKK